jgi:hypothetical protein
VTTPAIPVPTLVRLDYLTPDGWITGHKALNLLHPARYVERLLARGKFGRATALDDQLQPTGQVWVAEDLPDPGELVPSDTPIPVWSAEALPARVRCIVCTREHEPPYDGSCLI